jgi:hypothetical protein
MRRTAHRTGIGKLAAAAALGPLVVVGLVGVPTPVSAAEMCLGEPATVVADKRPGSGQATEGPDVIVSYRYRIDGLGATTSSAWRAATATSSPCMPDARRRDVPGERVPGPRPGWRGERLRTAQCERAPQLPRDDSPGRGSRTRPTDRPALHTDDVLIGGPGVDFAGAGAGGSDHCQAEVMKGCEHVIG